MNVAAPSFAGHQSPDLTPDAVGASRGSTADTRRGDRTPTASRPRNFKTIDAGSRTTSDHVVPSETASAVALDPAEARRILDALSPDPSPGNLATLVRLVARSLVDPVKGCWLWRGAKNSKGYGAIAMMVEERREYRSCSVHRVVAGIVFGPISDEALVCHTCDVRECWHPAHLYVGDAYSNMKDAKERGRTNNVLARRNREKTHCPKGHPYSPENTRIVSTSGERRCVTCIRANDARYAERSRARRGVA